MAAVSPITLLFRAVDQASPVLKNLLGSVRSQFEVVTSLSFAYNQVTQTIQAFAAQGRKAYDLLIGQNLELQSSLLSTQASLAATNKVLVNGLEVKDPAEAIKALEAPVREAIAQIRKGSLELVGVTSNDLIPLFQIIASQSSSIGANLNESADLALSFGAALQTAQIPLFQSRQEISSIINQQITSDSQLAKSLGLNNEMVGKWKAQGTFVQELNKKLEAFRAGNAIAAQTVGGISSNIEELVLEITRIAGEPLLDPLVKQLDSLYKFLQQNKDQIQEIATSAVNFFLQIGSKLGEAVQAIAPVIRTLGEALFNQLSAEAGAAGETIKLFVDAFVELVKASAPLLQVIANITLEFAKLANTPIGQVVIQAGLLLAVALKLAPAVAALTLAFDAFTVSVALSGGGLKGLTGALTAMIPLIGAAKTAIDTFTVSVALSGGGLVGTIGALKAFGVAAGAAIAPLLPIIALGGAIAVTLIIKKTGDLKNANEEIEEFRKQNDLLADESIRIASKLKALNDAEKENGKLTAEQARQRAEFQRIAAGQVEALRTQVELIKQTDFPPELKESQRSQIEGLEKIIAALQKQSGGVKTVAQDIQDLGNDYQQLSKKVAEAIAQFNKPANADQFKASAKNIVDFTNKQVELGQLTAQQAIAQLNRVRNDTRVELDLRLSAQEAITKIRQGEADKQVKVEENKQQQIQALIANEEISQYEGQRRISINKIKQLQIQLDAVRASIKEEEKLRKSQIETQLADLDKQIQEAETKRQKAEGGGDKGGARLAREEVARLQTQRAGVQQSLQINTDRLNQLKSQEQKFNSEIAQTQSQERQRVRTERLKDFDEQQQILDGQYAAQLVSEQEYNAKSLQLSRAKAQEELNQLAQQRTKLVESTKGKKLSPEEQQGVAEGLEAIAAREGAIRKQQLTAQDEYQQKSLQLLERSQKQALDVVSQSESDRLLQIAQLEKDDVIRKAEADKLRTESTGDRLREELRLEQERLQKLEALPPYGDPAKEEGRQAEIRASRKKTTDLTKSLIDNEIQQRDALYRVIEDQINRQIQGIQNVATAQNQAADAAVRGLEEQIKLSDLATKQLENQNRLLEARKNLVSSVSDYLQGQLDILKETTEDEEEKKRLSETQAEIRLKMVKQQAVIEKEILELNLQQKEAALEQEKVQLRIQQIQAKAATSQARADVLTAQFEQKKVAQDPNATQEQRDAASLKLEAALGRLEAAITNDAALQAQGALIGQKEDINRREAQFARDKQERDSQLQTDQARLNLAKSRVDEGQGKRESEQLRNEILRRGINENVSRRVDFADIAATGKVDLVPKQSISIVGPTTGKPVDYGAEVQRIEESMRSAQLQYQAERRGLTPVDLGAVFAQMLEQIRQGSGVAGVIPQSQFVGNVIAPNAPVQAREQKIDEVIATLAQKPTTVNITLNNEFKNADTQSAQSLVQIVRKELNDVAVTLGR